MTDWADLAAPEETVALERLTREAGLYSLVKQVTDLGVLAEDAVKLALESLFAAPEHVLPDDIAIEMAALLQEAHDRIHSEALALTNGPRMQASGISRVTAIEQLATHFLAIGTDGVSMLRRAIEIGGDCERLLPRGLRASGLLRTTLGEVVAGVRGAVLVCATAETGRAAAIYRQAQCTQTAVRATTEKLILALADPGIDTTQMQRLVQAVTLWGTITEHVTAVCEVEGSTTLPPRPLPPA